MQLFNEEIAPRSAQYKRERLQRENSNPSEDGITDGVTGRPINEQAVSDHYLVWDYLANVEQGTAPRRSSRRSSRAPSMETSPERSEEVSFVLLSFGSLSDIHQPKRRRASAQPSYGRAKAARKATAQPDLIEESEPESSEPERIIVQKRTKKPVRRSHHRLLGVCI